MQSTASPLLQTLTSLTLESYEQSTIAHDLQRYGMPVFYVIVSIYLLNPDDIYTITLYDVWLDTHQISE